MLRFLRNILY